MSVDDWLALESDIWSCICMPHVIACSSELLMRHTQQP